MYKYKHNWVVPYKETDVAKMSKQDKKIVQERIKVDAYGDERIEKAKGK